jgi:hypothetical protein
MTKYTKTILTFAAIAGLCAGSARALAADDNPGQPAPSENSKDKASCSGKNGCKGTADTTVKDSKDKASCSGKNGCKGKADTSMKDPKDKASCKSKASCSAKKDDKTTPAS